MRMTKAVFFPAFVTVLTLGGCQPQPSGAPSVDTTVDKILVIDAASGWTSPPVWRYPEVSAQKTSLNVKITSQGNIELDDPGAKQHFGFQVGSFLAYQAVASGPLTIWVKR